jgi:hypothetical protein
VTDSCRPIWEDDAVARTPFTCLLAVTTVLLVAGCGAKKPAPASAPAAASATQAHPQPTGGYVAVDFSGIKKAEGGKTVAEVYAEKDQLAGQKVTVRGKVVKSIANVMGKNWLHVRDGTGTEPANDLTVTTSAALPSLGATVVVTGTVARNRNLGLGYQYDVLIEDATVTVE